MFSIQIYQLFIHCSFALSYSFHSTPFPPTLPPASTHTHTHTHTHTVFPTPFKLFLFLFHKLDIFNNWGRLLCRKSFNLNLSDVSSGLIPGMGRCPGERNGMPLQYSCLGNLRQRSLAGYIPWGHRRVRHDSATKQPQK